MSTQNLPPRALNQLREIEAKLVALQAKKRELDSRARAGDRAARTRKNVIVGGWLAAHEPDTFQRVVAALTRPQDRAAFDLPALPEAMPAIDASEAV